MAGEWIEWNGGKCPVPYDALVEAVFADGFQPFAPREAVGSVLWRENWEWTNDGDMHRIVAYRVVKQ